MQSMSFDLENDIRPALLTPVLAPDAIRPDLVYGGAAAEMMVSMDPGDSGGWSCEKPDRSKRTDPMSEALRGQAG